MEKVILYYAFTPLPDPNTVSGISDVAGASMLPPAASDSQTAEEQDQASRETTVRTPTIQLQRAPATNRTTVPSASGSGSTVPLR